MCKRKVEVSLRRAQSAPGIAKVYLPFRLTMAPTYFIPESDAIKFRYLLIFFAFILKFTFLERLTKKGGASPAFSPFRA
jgi:hypothetical protein